MGRQRRKSSGLNNGINFLIIIAVIAGGLFFLYPPEEKVKLGLDLQGGVEVLLQADIVPGTSPVEADDTMSRIITILENRVNEFGLSNAIITRLGTDRVLVQVPGTQNVDEARTLIGRTALLEFKKVVEVGLSPDDTLSTSNPIEEVLRDTEGVPYIVEATTSLTGGALSDARAQTRTAQSLDSLRQGQNFVSLRFNDDGARVFADLINSMASGARLAIVLDGVIQSAPGIQQSLKDAAGRGPIFDAQIDGQFTFNEARQLAIILRAGALPVDVSVIQELTVGPTLGQDAIQRGQTTILIGFGLVLLYMLFVYRLWGIIADFALMLNMLIIFGTMAILGADLTLPGIAGLLLTVGMTVDANVIIFERIKEERRLGKSPHASLRDGFKKSLSAVLDANVTTLAAAAILYAVGTGPIKGFAVTLGLGILGSLFCALFVTRFLLEVTKLGHKAPGVKVGSGKSTPQAQTSSS